MKSLVSVGTALALFLAAPALARRAPPQRCAIVYVGPDALEKKILDPASAEIEKLMKKSRLWPVWVDPPAGLNARKCIRDDKCMGRLAKLQESPAVLLITLKKAGRVYRGNVRLWSKQNKTDLLDLFGTPRGLLEAMPVVIRQAIKDYAAGASPPEIATAQPPPPAVEKRSPPVVQTPRPPVATTGEPEPQPKIIDVTPAGAEVETESESPAQVSEVIEAHSADETPPLEIQEIVEPDEPLVINIELGVVGGWLPIQHPRTFMEGDELIKTRNVGTGGVGLVFNLQIPWIPVLYQTDQVNLLFVGSMFAMTFEPGLEARYPIDIWAVGGGARYVLGLVGLPLPGTTGLAVAHGVEGYAVGTVEVYENIKIALSAGYRYLPPLNQFVAGGDTYYTRTAAGEVWVLELSGPVVKLMATYGF